MIEKCVIGVHGWEWGRRSPILCFSVSESQYLFMCNIQFSIFMNDCHPHKIGTGVGKWELRERRVLSRSFYEGIIVAWCKTWLQNVLKFVDIVAIQSGIKSIYVLVTSITLSYKCFSISNGTPWVIFSKVWAFFIISPMIEIIYGTPKLYVLPGNHLN